MAASLVRTSLRLLSKRAAPSVSLTAAARMTQPRASMLTHAMRPFSIGTRACFSSKRFFFFQPPKKSSTHFLIYLPLSVDSELVHKLDEEVLYEKSNDEPEQPAFIQEFLEANSFKVNCLRHSLYVVYILSKHKCLLEYIIFFMQLEDKPGMDEVTLTRSFGNEKYVSP